MKSPSEQRRSAVTPLVVARGCRPLVEQRHVRGHLKRKWWAKVLHWRLEHRMATKIAAVSAHGLAPYPRPSHFSRGELKVSEAELVSDSCSTSPPELARVPWALAAKKWSKCAQARGERRREPRSA